MTVSEAQALGIAAFLSKPLEFRDLGLTIQQVLEQRRML
jgi:DNA-binding NarL/FixJ family response regulator